MGDNETLPPNPDSPLDEFTKSSECRIIETRGALDSIDPDENISTSPVTVAVIHDERVSEYYYII